jgi:hypothetical protein
MQPAAAAQEKGGDMTRVLLLKALVSFMLLVAAWVPAAHGQTATGTISGRVTDSGSAVLVGATIDLTSIERGTASTLTTNDAGIYVFQVFRRAIITSQRAARASSRVKRRICW